MSKFLHGPPSSRGPSVVRGQPVGDRYPRGLLGYRGGRGERRVPTIFHPQGSRPIVRMEDAGVDIGRTISYLNVAPLKFHLHYINS
jgi:hypothetical protein